MKQMVAREIIVRLFDVEWKLKSKKTRRVESFDSVTLWKKHLRNDRTSKIMQKILKYFKETINAFLK